MGISGESNQTLASNPELGFLGSKVLVVGNVASRIDFSY